jgi:hypothetical protein
MKANKAFLLVAVLAMLAVPLQVRAADYPTSELFLGLRYMNIAGQLNGFGWGTGYAYNFHKNFGLAAELGGVYGSGNGRSFNLHDILVGPRVTLRGEPLSPFAHFMIGGGVASASGIGSASGFMFAAGGGLDYSLSKAMSFRIAQVDYVALTGGGTVNSVRAQSGLVWKFGN